eukprot:TRINITY_DN20915_c0_g1_i1.p1 TRINITY_DN20915_c0_g1~~TRINITY_DN20915_c0_g1_i1.p1  ORF type:complete len:523 (+),score=165.42 TRINITY_DN20915_c0_g1_i1:47-1570(+)
MAGILDAFVVGNGPCGLAIAAALTGHVTAMYNGPHYARGVETTFEAALGKSGVLIDAAALDTLTPDRLPYPSERSKNPAAVLYDSLNHPFADASSQRYGPLLRYSRRPTDLKVRCVGRGPYGGSWADMPESLLTLSPGSWMNLPGPTLEEYYGSDLGGRITRGEVLRYYQAYPSLVGLRSVVSEHVEVVSAALEPQAGNGTDGAPLWRIVTRGVAGGQGGADEIHYARNLILANGMYDRPKRLNGSHAPAQAAFGPLEDAACAEEACSGAVNMDARCQEAPPEPVAEDFAFVTHRSPAADWYKEVGGSGGRRYLMVVGAGLTAADCIASHLAALPADAPVTILHVFKELDASPLAKFKDASPMYREYGHLIALMQGAAQDPRYRPCSGRVLKSVSGTQEVVLGGAEGSGAAEETVRVDRLALLLGSLPALDFLGPAERRRVAAMATIVERKFTLPVDPWTLQVPGVHNLYAAGPVRGDNFVRFVVGDGVFITRSILKQRRLAAADRA